MQPLKSSRMLLVPLIAFGLVACSEEAGKRSSEGLTGPANDSQVADAAARLWNGGAKRPQDARATLDRLAQLIGATGSGVISIEGHTDAKGDDDYNKRLSQARAEAVKSYLTEKSVGGDRLRTIGLGELRPIAPNAKADGTDDEDGRRRNRRVEVILPRKQNVVAHEEIGVGKR